MNTWDAIKLGLLVSMRSMTLPAVMSDYLSHRRPAADDNLLYKLLGTQEIAQLTKVMASGEVAADKTPFIPNRTDWMPLLGRMGVAGIMAGVLARRGERMGAAAAAVGAAAVGSHLAYRLRKGAKERFRLPDLAVALAEDAIVLNGSLAWRDTYAADQPKLDS